MKKSVYIAITALAAMASCTGGKSDTETSDTVATEIIPDPYLSPDLRYADLRGPVERCVVTTTDKPIDGDTAATDESITTTITQIFDTNGYISEVVTENFIGKEPVDRSTFTFKFGEDGSLTESATDMDGRLVAKRGPGGYIKTFASINNAGETDYTKAYTWDGDKLMSVSIVNDRQPGDPGYRPLVDVTDYTYTPDGLRTREVEESGDKGLQLSVTETDYEYTATDGHGNWTRRDILRVAKVYDIAPGQRRTMVDSAVTRQAESRQITYRQEKPEE